MAKLRWHNFPKPMQAIKSDQHAKRSYDKLLAQGLKSTDIFQGLLGMAAADSEKEPIGWYSGNGKAFAGFLRRVKDMTAEMERLNADPRFIPEKDFSELPDLLRRYSAFIDERYRLLLQSRKGRPGTKAQIFDCLRSLVRHETGEERPADLAKILDAVTRGTPGYKDGFEFEAALKMRAQRKPLA